ncbi:hypothetical protein [Helicobacter zhangjianzhongii]|uniref:hypothetical protein n=1 Tax=Helicobacter zhangjianzhongii TaxID=2974574 RepID=UPI0025524E27|nr:hypothetical protein [Helicobacter sp. CPD2-1]MDL0080871.1 hypothetical protein [Helicobacter sp. CPD2-1]
MFSKETSLRLFSKETSLRLFWIATLCLAPKLAMTIKRALCEKVDSMGIGRIVC